MPKKPTTTYGYISFGKDGTVTKVMHTLPADKEAQEQRAAEHFVGFRFPDVNAKAALKRLPERDNDFRLMIPGRHPITLELVEIASRDYIYPIDQDEWSNNSHKYPQTMQRNEVVDGKLTVNVFNIDLQKKAGALTEKIRKKLRYSKPTDSDFWLLIWTVETEFTYVGSGPDGDFEDDGVRAAREFASAQPQSLYEEIWVSNMLGAPHQVFGARPTVVESAAAAVKG
jgi:hypothetical protein